MKIIRFILSLALTITLITLASWHQPFGVPVPPLGNLINPFSGFWQNAEGSAESASLNLDLPGLEQAVEVVFDERLVPHIFAQSLKDAYVVQGYLTAKYRLWQMDISTRAVGGRLAEVMGPRLLSRDRIQRRKGILFAAENSLASWYRNAEEKAFIEAYTLGVNAWIDQLDPKDYPIEFKLLNYAPEPWTAMHCALFFKSMAESLCARHRDIPSTNTRIMLGDSLFQFLYPERIPEQSPIIPATVEWNFEPTDSMPTTELPSDLSNVIPYQTFPLAPAENGSNNWAVSGNKTASGFPILCNDPHLGLTLPAIWYELQIHTPEINTYGVSLPGIPGIIIGFNENIAWGVTNAGHDVLDWYQIQWTDDTKTAYLLDGQPTEVEYVVERIAVLGQEDLLDTVKYTVWGPVVYETADSDYQDMAMRWLAHDKAEEKPFYELGTFQRLMSAKNVEDYQNALKGYDAPAQNFAFASKSGDIAMTVNGKLPLKANQQGRFVQDGSSRSAAWQGFIPRKQIPQDLNPKRGFVASANQHSAAENYPYYYNGGFDEYRGRYINRRLDSLSEITVEDMKKLQLDNYGLVAEEGTPLFLSFLESIAKSPPEQAMFDALKEWDYRFEEKAKAPIVFRRLLQETYKETFDEIFALRDSMEILFPDEWRLLALLKDSPNHPIFDIRETEEVETASNIVVLAFQKIASDMAARWSNEGYNWGRYKNTRIQHIGFIPAFGEYGIMVGGYKDAPNAIKDDHGPSWRMIVAFGPQMPEALGVYPGGQSGNPGSPYYNNAIETWTKGEYYPLQLLSSPEDSGTTVLFKQSFQ